MLCNAIDAVAAVDPYVGRGGVGRGEGEETRMHKEEGREKFRGVCCTSLSHPIDIGKWGLAEDFFTWADLPISNLNPHYLFAITTGYVLVTETLALDMLSYKLPFSICQAREMF